MNPKAIIRAWKDPAFRASLSPEQREQLPENPSGEPLTELDDAELGKVNGGIYFSSPVVCQLTESMKCLPP